MAEENIEQEQTTNKATVEDMMKESLALTKEIHEMMEKTKRYMAIRAIMGVVYLILILGPIVLAFIYLPPLLQSFISQYQSLFNVGSGAGVDFSEILQMYNSGS